MRLKPTMFLTDQPDTIHVNESNNRPGGLRECKWEPSVEFEIPDDWVSGVYLGKLTAKKERLQSYVIFIVRDDRPCDLLLPCSDTTWAAFDQLATTQTTEAIVRFVRVGRVRLVR